MKIIPLLKWFAKALFAGCFALLFITLFCLFYYNVPLHYPNPSGATDYIWESNAFYSHATEGISNGKTNNEGFYNIFDYESDMPINILIMGASHMEGSNVAPSEMTASQLNILMPDKTTYNIGISAHTFPICCNNFNAAIQTYHPSEYVIIDTSSLSFSSEQLQSVLDGTISELADHSGGIVGFLSRNQFFRLVYTQLKSWLGKKTDEEQDIAVIVPAEEEDSIDPLSDVLAMISQTAKENDVRIIVLYHPTTQLNVDGTLLLPDDADEKAIFTDLCEQNGILFLDMTERFQYEYDINYILPYGFINTSVGNGHLNKYGHAMIADELYQLISSQENN